MNGKIYTSKTLLTLVLIALFCFQNIRGNSIQYCDSLIKAGEEAMYKKEHEKSLQLLIEARNIAEKHNWYHRLFGATMNIGANYYQMMDYGEALKQYLESYKIAMAHLDSKKKLIILNNIAILYCDLQEFKKAEWYFKKSYELAKKNKDSLKMGYCLINLGVVANGQGDIENSEKYVTASQAYFRNDPLGQLMSGILSTQNDLLRGHNQEARSKAKALISSMKNEKNKDNLIDLYFTIAKSYLNENNTEKGLFWINKTLHEKPKLNIRSEAFDFLSDIYFKTNRYETALKYKDSVNITDKKIDKIRNTQLFKASEIKFQIENYKKEIALKDISFNKERNYFYSIIIVVLILILFLIVIFRNQLIRNRQQKLINNCDLNIMDLKLQKKTDANLLLKQKERSAIIEQEQLKKEIELKNQKISAKVLYISDRDELLQEVLNSLSKVPEVSGNNTLINHIRTLKSNLKAAADWDQSIMHFEEVNLSLLKKLKAKHPELTSNDMRYISYVYMNLSTKEIAGMLNITEIACKNREKRINDRLGINDEMPLIDYLSSV